MELEWRAGSTAEVAADFLKLSVPINILLWNQKLPSQNTFKKTNL